MWSACLGPFVPVHSEPAKSVEDPGDHVRRGTFCVGVLDSQNEGSAGAASVEPVEKGSAGAADVEITRWRRSEADAGRHAIIIGRPWTPTSRRRQQIARTGRPR